MTRKQRLTGQDVDVSVLALVVRVIGAVGRDAHVYRADLHVLQKPAGELKRKIRFSPYNRQPPLGSAKLDAV